MIRQLLASPNKKNPGKPGFFAYVGAELTDVGGYRITHFFSADNGVTGLGDIPGAAAIDQGLINRSLNSVSFSMQI